MEADQDGDADSDIQSDYSEYFLCPNCPKKFKHKTTLSRHVNSECGTLKKHLCNICEKGFDRFDSLTRHIKTCEQKIRIWQCVNCGKEFSFQCHLKKHLESCNTRCVKCKKKLKDGIEHTCKLLKIKLPKLKEKAEKKTLSSPSFQYIEPEHLNDLIALSMLVDVEPEMYTDFQINFGTDQPTPDATSQMVRYYFLNTSTNHSFNKI